MLLAGDAAHVHAPTGGQGLNLGIQDAVNLGWKLAQVVHGTSPDSLLDTYHAERHPIAARVLKATLAQVAMMRGDDRAKALHEVMSDLFKMDEPRKRYAGMMSALDIHYDLGSGHPLLGRRMPDLDLIINGRDMRVFSLMHQANALVLDFGEARTLDAVVAPWSETNRLQFVRASYDGAWDLPVIGAVPRPAAVLVRPDGYVAWVGEGSEQGLPEALTRWLGPKP